MQKLVEGCEGTWSETDDLLLLCELGEEGADEGTREEIRAIIPTLEATVARMEFARMLSGEHDARSAIVSINAGAGGTEAQDWADMLLRMFLRYCEKRGYKHRNDRLSAGG